MQPQPYQGVAPRAPVDGTDNATHQSSGGTALAYASRRVQFEAMTHSFAKSLEQRPSDVGSYINTLVETLQRGAPRIDLNPNGTQRYQHDVTSVIPPLIHFYSELGSGRSSTVDVNGYEQPVHLEAKVVEKEGVYLAQVNIRYRRDAPEEIKAAVTQALQSNGLAPFTRHPNK